jgi:predicted site-specific integrase-resolvase
MYDCVEISELLGVTRNTVAVWCRTGKIKCKVDKTETNRPYYKVEEKDLVDFGRRNRKYGRILNYCEAINSSKKSLNELVRILKREEGLGK